MEEYRKEYPVSVLCETLGVSPSGYYAWKKRPMSRHQWQDQQLVEHIEEVYHSCRQVGKCMAVRAFMQNCGTRDHEFPQTGGTPDERTGLVCSPSAASDDYDEK